MEIFSWTDLIIVAGTVLVLFGDAAIYRFWGEPATISWRMAYWSKRAPIVAVLVGILVGHLFWPNKFYCP